MAITPFHQPLDYGFTPLPFDDIFRGGALMQQQEDKAKADMLEFGSKKLKFLPGSRESAKADREWLDQQTNALYDKSRSRGSGLRGVQDDLHKARQEYKNKFNEFSLDNARETRANEYAATLKKIQDNKDLNPLQKEYYLNQVIPQAEDKDEYNPNTGSYKHIKGPEEFEWKDTNKEIDNALSHIAADQQYKNKGYGNSPLEFVKAFKEGTIKGKDRAKISETLAQRLGSDKNLIKSSQVTADHFIPNNDVDESSFYSIIKDPKTGENRVEFNTNTLLGQNVSGAVRGATYREENFNTDHIRDTTAEKKAEKEETENNAIIVSNATQVESMTSADFAKQLGDIKTTQAQITTLANSLTPELKAKDPRAYATGEAELKDLAQKQAALENSKKIIESNMEKAGFSYDKAVEDAIKISLASPSKDLDVATELTSVLSKLPVHLRTTNLTVLLEKYNKLGEGQGKIDLIEDIIAESKKAPATKKAFNTIKDNLVEMANSVEDPGIIKRTDKQARLLGIASKIKEVQDDYAESNAAISIGTATLTPDPSALKEERTLLSQVVDAYSADVQGGTNYTTYSGLSLSDYAANTPVKDAKGKDTKISTSNSVVLPTHKPINGKFYLQAALKDDGKNNVYDEKGQAVFKLVAPENQESYKQTLTKVGKQMMTSKDPARYKEGFEVLSNVTYGGELSTANPELMKPGQRVPVTIQTPAGPVNGEVVKNEQTISFVVKDRVGQNIKLNLALPTGQEATDFSTTEELSQSLYNSYNIKR